MPKLFTEVLAKVSATRKYLQIRKYSSKRKMAFSFIMQFGQGIKQQNLEGLGGNFHKEWRIVVTKPRKLWRKYFGITVAHTYERTWHLQMEYDAQWKDRGRLRCVCLTQVVQSLKDTWKILVKITVMFQLLPFRLMFRVLLVSSGSRLSRTLFKLRQNNAKRRQTVKKNCC